MGSEWGIEIGEEGVAGVFFAENSLRRINPPVNAERGVGDGNATIGLGGVEIIAFILEHSGVAQHGEAMSEATGYKELEMIVLGELDSDVATIGGRVAPDVDCNIKDTPSDTADELGLSEGGALEMKASHHAFGGTGFIVLDEIDRTDEFIKDLFVIAFKKIAASIGKNAGLKDYNALDVSFNNLHS